MSTDPQKFAEYLRNNIVDYGGWRWTVTPEWECGDDHEDVIAVERHAPYGIHRPMETWLSPDEARKLRNELDTALIRVGRRTPDGGRQSSLFGE